MSYNSSSTSVPPRRRGSTINNCSHAAASPGPLHPPSIRRSSPYNAPSFNAIARHGYQNPRHHHSQQNSNPILQSIRSRINSLHRNLKQNDLLPTDNTKAVATFLSGTLAFYSTACSCQYMQYKLLKMSTGTRPAIIPITVGALTVGVASWMSHLAGVGTSSAWSTVRASWNASGAKGVADKLPEIGTKALGAVEEMIRPMEVVGSLRGLLLASDDANLSGGERRERKEVWMHAARICILGLLTYKLALGSNFSSLSPSSYTARGSFARVGIPAPPNFNYATSSQRTKIEQVGRRWGCHTCGSRMVFSNLRKGGVPKFHGDHIPPVSVAKQMNGRWYRKALGLRVSQKFYPQCRNCSNKQGGLLAKAVSAGHKNLHSAGGGGESYFHGRRLRIGHLAGGAVAALSVGKDDGSESTLVKSSRERVGSYQDWAVDFGRALGERAGSVWRNFR